MENENPIDVRCGALVEKAKNGDTESARQILRSFCGAIKANTDKNGKPHRKPSGTGTQIPEVILRYLGECFETILDDVPGARKDANHALGISAEGKRGRKKTSANRERDMCSDVRDRHKEIKAKRKESKIPHPRGVTPLNEAIQDVAEKYKTGIDAVTNAYKKYKRYLLNMEDQ